MQRVLEIIAGSIADWAGADAWVWGEKKRVRAELVVAANENALYAQLVQWVPV